MDETSKNTNDWYTYSGKFELKDYFQNFKQHLCVYGLQSRVKEIFNERASEQSKRGRTGEVACVKTSKQTLIWFALPSKPRHR